MYESIEVVEFFIEIIERMMGREITFNSPLEEMVLSAGRNDLAYVDNRRDARKMGYDFWEHLRMRFKDDALFKRWLRDNRIDKKFLYSKSEQFPDFLFKVRKHEDNSKIIDACLKSSFDIDLDLINEHFKELKRLIPNLEHSTELIRIVWIRFYRLSDSKQKMKIKEIDDAIKKVFKKGVNLIGDIE